MGQKEERQSDIGPARLIQGDCLRVLPTLAPESVDLILCDLPYGQTHNTWDCPIDMDKLWGEYRRIIRDHGAIILFGSGRFTASLMVSAKDLYRYNLVWQKTKPGGFLNAKRMPLRGHEDIVVCYKHMPKYHPQMSHGHERKVSTAAHKRNCKKTTNYGSYEHRGYDSTDRYPTSVLTFALDQQKEAYHPTQKPVALLEWLIRSYTDEGALVLDNCMGSGSTGVAAARTGRRFIGIEKEEPYFLIARDRVRAAVEGDGLPARGSKPRRKKDSGDNAQLSIF